MHVENSGHNQDIVKQTEWTTETISKFKRDTALELFHSNTWNKINDFLKHPVVMCFYIIILVVILLGAPFFGYILGQDGRTNSTFNVAGLFAFILTYITIIFSKRYKVALPQWESMNNVEFCLNYNHWIHQSSRKKLNVLICKQTRAWDLMTNAFSIDYIFDGNQFYSPRYFIVYIHSITHRAPKPIAVCDIISKEIVYPKKSSAL